MSSELFDLVILGGGIVGLWTALEAESMGLKVAVVEVGPGRLTEAKAPQPELTFPERRNIGSIEARNHVLTGNSAFWGGGLVRNPRNVLEDLFPERLAMAVEGHYDRIERTLGIVPREATRPCIAVPGQTLAEIAVLPGRRRGIWSNFLQGGNSTITAYTSARIQSVDWRRDDGIQSVDILDAEANTTRLISRHFVLSMGVIDSIHFVRQRLMNALPPEAHPETGRRLHDHWSVPVAKLRWKNGSAASELFPPKFLRGGIVGRRLLLDNGFFHVIADYDAMPPFDRVKTFLKARQRGEGLASQLRAAVATLGHPWLMARAGLHYLRHHELLVPDGEEVTLTLDFESAAHPANQLAPDGERLAFHWDLRDEDRQRFRHILESNREVIESGFKANGIELRWLCGKDTGTFEEHLKEHAIDAYHLGGGLQPLPEGGGCSTRDGFLKGCPNLFVNSAATFVRPGTANPVLTLLARASAYVRELASRRAS